MPRTKEQLNRRNRVVARMVSEYLRSGKTVPVGFEGTLFDFARHIADDVLDDFQDGELEEEITVCELDHIYMANGARDASDYCMGCGELRCTCSR